MSHEAFLVRLAIDTSLRREKQGPTYFVRPAGSFVVGQTRDKTDADGGRKIAEWLTTLDWEEVTSQVRTAGAGYGAVRYFEAPVPEGIEAIEGVLLWGELTPEQRATVRVQQAHHEANGEELVTDQIPLKRATKISIMVGDAVDPQVSAVPGLGVVYTWFPGRVTPFRKAENLQQQLEEGTLDYYATVKSLA